MVGSGAIGARVSPTDRRKPPCAGAPALSLTDGPVVPDLASKGGRSRAGAVLSNTPEGHSILRIVAHAFLEAMQAAESINDRERVLGAPKLTALLARAKPERVVAKHGKGRVSCYTRSGKRIKDKVRKSQRSNRAAGGGACTNKKKRRLSSSSAPMSAEDHVGVLVVPGMSDKKCNPLRFCLGTETSRMESTDDLRSARAAMANSPAATVEIDDTGAHIKSMRASAESLLGVLWDAGIFKDRPVRARGLSRKTDSILHVAGRWRAGVP